MEEIKEGIEIEKRESIELEERKEKAIKFLKEYKNYIQYIILAIIIWISYNIRTKNLPILKDITIQLSKNKSF